MKNKPAAPTYSEYDNFAFHPYNVMLMLLLIAITALFLGTSAAFIYTRVTNGVGAVKIPWLFAFNTLILLASSYAMQQAKKAYLDDQTKTYQSCLLATIGLTFIFLGLQFAAWSQLFSVNIFLASNNAASYLYLLSGLHFAHVLAGLPFLGLFLWKSKKLMIDPVTVLVYFSDPEKRLRLRLLSTYWHYLDALWVFLVLFLFANQLIS
ncbi:MAG: cytochrome c oxidase subunit 3 [Saprospiraceae bacterium]|nr:cytochrome c oxidase subunit 3 [Saprospiraceae bacterium]